MSDFWSQFSKPAPADAVQSNAANQSTLFAIEHKHVLSIAGPDASKFMQGQFTCNLKQINGQQYSRGAVCSAKGRMVANFDLGQFSDDFLMSTQRSLAPVVLAHLKKYMVFFKCKMQQEDYLQVGLKGPDAHSLLQRQFGLDDTQLTDDFSQFSFEHGIIIKLPFGAGFEIWLQTQHAADNLNILTSECTLSTDQHWQTNLIQAGLGQLDDTLSESLIPQMINLGQTGGISFNKGCYTGQEIVARMQYLGKLKRHGYILKLDGQTPLHTGQDIFTPDHKSPVGSVVNLASLNDGQYVFAVLEDKYKDAPLCFGEGATATPVQHLPLPYPLTEENDES